MDYVLAILCLIPLAFVIMKFYRNKSHGNYDFNIPEDILNGKVVVLTGTSSGIGKTLAHQLMCHGATVVGGCRSVTKNSLIDEDDAENKFVELLLDLSSFESVLLFYRSVSSKYKKVDILINNAGYMGPKKMSLDGNDYCFQVNYLSHFLLTLLFLGGRIDADDDLHHNRLLIINLTSDIISRATQLISSDVTALTNQNEFSIVTSYANTKLCMVLFSDEVQRKYHDQGVDVLSIHPGRVQSDLQKHWPGLRGVILRFVSYFILCPTDAAAKNIFNLCIRRDVEKLSGGLFYEKKMVRNLFGCHQRSEENAKHLWKLSLEMTQNVTPAETFSAVFCLSNDESNLLEK